MKTKKKKRPPKRKVKQYYLAVRFHDGDKDQITQEVITFRSATQRQAMIKVLVQSGIPYGTAETE